MDFQLLKSVDLPEKQIAVNLVTFGKDKYYAFISKTGQSLNEIFTNKRLVLNTKHPSFKEKEVSVKSSKLPSAEKRFKELLQTAKHPSIKFV